MVVESAVGINWLPLWQPFVAPLFWLVVEVFARRVKKQEESKESDLEKATGKITLPADSSEEKATNIDHPDKSYRPLGKWKAIFYTLTGYILLACLIVKIIEDTKSTTTTMTGWQIFLRHCLRTAQSGTGMHMTMSSFYIAETNRESRNCVKVTQFSIVIIFLTLSLVLLGPITAYMVIFPIFRPPSSTFLP